MSSMFKKAECDVKEASKALFLDWSQQMMQVIREYGDEKAAQRFGSENLDKKNIIFFTQNLTALNEAAAALERQHSIAKSSMVVSIEELLGCDLGTASDEEVAQLTGNGCRKALCIMLKLHAHQCVSNVANETIRRAGQSHFGDASEKYEELARQLAAKIDRLEEEVHESERAATSTAKHIRELRDRVKQLTTQVKNKPTSGVLANEPSRRTERFEGPVRRPAEAMRDLTDKNKQLLDDVDCMRTDCERKQEELDLLRGQPDKLRAEKKASGAAKGATKTKK